MSLCHKRTTCSLGNSLQQTDYLLFQWKIYQIPMSSSELYAQHLIGTCIRQPAPFPHSFSGSSEGRIARKILLGAESLANSTIVYVVQYRELRLMFLFLYKKSSLFVCIVLYMTFSTSSMKSLSLKQPRSQAKDRRRLVVVQQPK